MANRFVDDAAKEAFTEAIRTVEAESSVEVVIKVRHHSGSYIHADLLVAIIIGLATLAFMLFSPSLDFSITSLFIDPVIIGAAFGLLSTQLPFVRRHLTPGRRRRRQVREAAESGFFQRGVSHTTGRTGILVYASLLEREVELVCDRGVTEALTDDEIDDHRERLTRALRTDFRGVALAKAVEGLADVCSARLPRAEDDINELPDQVYFHP
jgi:putative membrane protein